MPRLTVGPVIMALKHMHANVHVFLQDFGSSIIPVIHFRGFHEF